MRPTTGYRSAIRVAALCAIVPVVGSCGLLGLGGGDKGKFKSLPTSCANAAKSQDVATAVDAIFSNLSGDHTFKEVDVDARSDLEYSSYASLKCTAKVDLGYSGKSYGQPETRDLEVEFKRYKPQRYGEKNAVKAAHKDTKAADYGVETGSSHGQPGVGDEAVAWWSKSGYLSRKIVFRVSNMVVEVGLEGRNYPPDEHSYSSDDNSPELRQDLEPETLAVAKALASWLKNS